MKREHIKKIVEENEINWADDLKVDKNSVYEAVTEVINDWGDDMYGQLGFPSVSFMSDEKVDEYEGLIVSYAAREFLGKLELWAYHDMDSDPEEYKEYRGEDSDFKAIWNALPDGEYIRPYPYFSDHDMYDSPFTGMGEEVYDFLKDEYKDPQTPEARAELLEAGIVKESWSRLTEDGIVSKSYEDEDWYD